MHRSNYEQFYVSGCSWVVWPILSESRSCLTALSCREFVLDNVHGHIESNALPMFCCSSGRHLVSWVTHRSSKTTSGTTKISKFCAYIAFDDSTRSYFSQTKITCNISHTVLTFGVFNHPTDWCKVLNSVIISQLMPFLCFARFFATIQFVTRFYGTAWEGVLCCSQWILFVLPRTVFLPCVTAFVRCDMSRWRL
jgi:hypothetical protein